MFIRILVLVITLLPIASYYASATSTSSGTTSAAGPTLLPPGASVPINVFGVPEGNPSGSACPGSNFCLAIVPPSSAATQSCPSASILSTLPTCSASNAGQTCIAPNSWAVPKCSSAISGYPNGYCAAQFFTGNYLSGQNYDYNACGYYGTGGSYASMTSIGNQVFTLNGISAPEANYQSNQGSYLLYMYTNPVQFSVGAAPQIISYVEPYFASIKDPVYSYMCEPTETCILEFANAITGCLNPATTPLPTCTSGTVGQACRVNDTGNLYTQGFNYPNFYHYMPSYTQQLDSAYLTPSNTYDMCMYDYSYRFDPYQYISVDTGTMAITCNALGGCTTNGANPPPPPGQGLWGVEILPCSYCGITISVGNFGAGGSITPFQSSACNIYGFVILIFGGLALVLLLTGAILYMGANTLGPHQGGQVKGYATGLLLVGGIVAAITGMAIFLMSLTLQLSPVGSIVACAVTL